MRDVAADHKEPRISVWQIRDALGDRAYGPLLFVFAMLNLIPVPPGAGFVLALPVLLVALELVSGKRTPYFPAWLGKRSFAIEDFRATVDRVGPVIGKIERLLRPRLIPLATGTGERFVGLVCLVLSIVLFLPIPLLGNWPPALAICLLAIAVLQRDGLAVLVGLVAAAVSLTIAWGTLIAAIMLAFRFLSAQFG